MSLPVACPLASISSSTVVNRELSSSDVDHLFQTLIEEPLFTLVHNPREQLPVVVVDALDECGGLRHDPSGRKDYEALLCTLKR